MNVPNFSIKSILENTSTTVMNDTVEAAASTDSNESLVVQKVTKKKELSYEGHCEEHFSPNHFKCMNCNQYICGTCALLMHKSCTEVLPILEALNLMKGEKLKKIKVFKTKLEKEAQMIDSKLDHLNKKQEKLYQELEIVAVEVKKTKSKKERNKKLHEDSTVHEETLENATCNKDYEKADAKVNFFFEENSSSNIRKLTCALKATKKDLQENTFYVTKVIQEAMKYSKVMVKDDQIIFDDWEELAEGGSSCIDFLDFINSRTAVLDTHKFIEEHKKELHNPRLPKDRIKFSIIEVLGKEVFFNAFKTSNKSDFVIKFESIVKTLGCSSVIPEDAFLKPRSLSGHLEINTDGGSQRAINFLLLSSGIMDDSYQGTQLLNYNDLVLEGGLKNSYFPGVVEGIKEGGLYERVKPKRGEVEGGNANFPNELSFFCVLKKDSSNPSSSIFGRVKRGMEVLDQIERKSVINECGLIFELS